jgi:hypothetical protein
VVYFGGFFAKLGHFAGFLKLLFGWNSEAVMAGAGVGGHNMINMKIITELYALSRICFKTGIFAVFSLQYTV